jgi:hypothetical protein
MHAVEITDRERTATEFGRESGEGVEEAHGGRSQWSEVRD